jgi:hypothetical protein
VRWFKHDSDAHTDAKLKRLIMRHGLEGYGLYWYCLELIAADIDTHNLTFELEHDAELIAHDLSLHYEKVQDMMRCMVDLGLFESSAGGRVTCLKMLRRLDSSMTSNAAMRQMIAKAKEGHDWVMTGSCQSHDGVMQEQKRREQKRLEEKRTEKTTSPPAVADDDGAPEPCEVFWSAYPRKTSKQEAKKAFKKARVSPDFLVSDIEERLRTGHWSDSEKAYIPHPSTYLNQKRWEDEIVPRPEKASRTKDLERQHAEVLRRHLDDEEESLCIEKR